MSELREMRDFNPCGVNHSVTQEKYFTGVKRDPDGMAVMDGPLYKFQTFNDGLFAAAVVLKNVTMGKYGANTPALVAYHWTGRTKAQGSYDGADLAVAMGEGYSSDTVLDFTNDGPNILYGLVANENNFIAADLIPDSAYQDAVTKALGVS